MILPDRTWVSATASRNWCHQDPILDWLDLYGCQAGFVSDTLRAGYDAQTDMGAFLSEKGTAFETAVMSLIEAKFRVVRIAERSADAYDLAMYERTIQAMRDGEEVLYHAVVWDADRKTLGIPDLLVRSDILNRLVDCAPLSSDEAKESATALDLPYHYRVVDLKFTSLELSSKGWIGNDSSDRRRKTQLLVYNRALAQMQGYWPPVAYLLGRSWKQTIKKETSRSDSCFDRLAPADMNNPQLESLTDDAISWVNRVRSSGSGWSVLPSPTVPELFPNMSNTQDTPWHLSKQEIADQLRDVTLLWQITPTHRPNAHAAGVYGYLDPACDASVFGISADRTEKLRQILAAQKGTDLVMPAHVSSERSVWGEPQPLEFYVDFETVTDLDDDFSTLPKKGGQTLIFMIGCGHVEEGEWKFQVFTCGRLTQECEASIIEAWHTHMREVRSRLWPEGNPLVFHWSHAERSFLDTAYNSARVRHGVDWPDINWFDFLVKVIRQEPTTVRHALAFGLKSVAKAMHKNKLIETGWDSGPGDGLGAMVGAWRCNAAARQNGGTMRDLPLMKSIEDYNEVDCKVMQEIIAYLRENH